MLLQPEFSDDCDSKYSLPSSYSSFPPLWILFLMSFNHYKIQMEYVMKQHLFYTKTSCLSEFGKNKPQIYQDTTMSFPQEQYSVIEITDINISHDKTNAVCTTIIRCALTNLFFTRYIWSISLFLCCISFNCT